MTKITVKVENVWDFINSESWNEFNITYCKISGIIYKILEMHVNQNELVLIEK